MQNVFMQKIKFSFSVLLLVLLSTQSSLAKDKQDFEEPFIQELDSAHSVALDLTIDNGVMYSDLTRDSALEREISYQLFYTIGQLNGVGGVGDLNSLKISIQNKTETSPGVYLIEYKAQMTVAWPNDVYFPKNYTLKVPAWAKGTNALLFFSDYGNDEHSTKSCLAWEAHDVSAGIFWYYYRPDKSSCSLRSVTTSNDKVSVLTASLQKSGINTTGKYPEYDKIWEDDTLVFTTIFGMNDANAGATDAGVNAYLSFYKNVIGFFGTPKTTSLKAGQIPGLSVPHVKVTFDYGKKKVEANLYLVKSLAHATSDATFLKEYNELTKTSDFISYSGHSGLGANIRLLAQLGEFEKGKYQIFLINGCDTFAYVDSSLTDAHADVNPGEAGTKYLDVITNAMPSYFNMNSRTNTAIVQALYWEKDTYRQIMSSFDKNQRAVVTGEEDNLWPLPF